MHFKREFYLSQLEKRMNNGLIKVITGLRRSGKSYLIFNIFKNYLLEKGIMPEQIIQISLDDENYINLRNHKKLNKYIENRIVDKQQYYLLIDEVQLVDGFESVLIKYMRLPNVDVYVTGSNSKFLSVDIDTTLNGKNDPIHIYPLSFQEINQAYNNPVAALNDYMLFGGLPHVFQLTSFEQKAEYLSRIFNELYMKDVIARNRIDKKEQMKEIVKVLSSSVGSFVNSKNIANTILSTSNVKIKSETIKRYINHLKNAFLINDCERYDIKGRKYIGALEKYYFEDIGIRNGIINFRQTEKTHMLENVVFNELKRRGYSVDVGFIDTWTINKMLKSQRTRYEIDFVCNRGYERYYIQCIYGIENKAKKWDEERPFKFTNDNFKKIIITYDSMPTHYDDNGVLIMDIYNFLLDDKSLEK